MISTELASVPSRQAGPLTDQLQLAVTAYLARFKVRPVSTPNRTCAATSPGAQSSAWTRWPPSGRTWSCTSGGCRKSAGSSPPRRRETSQAAQTLGRSRQPQTPGQAMAAPHVPGLGVRISSESGRITGRVPIVSPP